MESKTHISKYSNKVTLWLVIIAAVFVGTAGLINIFFGFFGSTLNESLLLSTLLIVLSVLLAYLIKSNDTISSKIESLNELTDHTTATVYGSIDEFYIALLNASRNSTNVYTHMFSAPPNMISEESEEYFNSMHLLLSNGNKKFGNFRRIAGVHSKKKAQWIIDTLYELRDSVEFSLAIQYAEDEYPITSFHVAESNNVSEVFVWLTMEAGGFGKAFSVSSNAVAKLMVGEHEREFNSSVALKSGKRFYWENVKALVKRYNLENLDSYVNLIKHENQEI